MGRVLAYRNKERAFTLLEVMVALAILAIALTSIYRLQGQTILMNGSARFYSLAPQLARLKLAEIERQEFNDIAGGSGDFGEAYPRYTWTSGIEEVTSDLITDKKYHLARIDITVTNNDEDSYRLRTYRFYAE